MAVGEVSEEFNIVGGVQLASTHCGIKATGDDLVVIAFREGTTTAGVFTQNAFCAAPVTVCRQHLQDGSPRYFLINSGNANAGTGEVGMLDAMNCCAKLVRWRAATPGAAILHGGDVSGCPLKK